MIVTSETITDDQIFELYRIGDINAYQLMMARSDAPNWRSDPRARCATIWNVRHAASQEAP